MKEYDLLHKINKIVNRPDIYEKKLDTSSDAIEEIRKVLAQAGYNENTVEK